MHTLNWTASPCCDGNWLLQYWPEHDAHFAQIHAAVSEYIIFAVSEYDAPD